MNSPGALSAELLGVADHARRIHQAFAQNADDARVRALERLARSLIRLLDHAHSVCLCFATFYPAVSNCKRLLNGCDSFVRTYSQLKDGSVSVISTADGPSTSRGQRRVWLISLRTFHHSCEGRKQELEVESLKLLKFIIITAVTRNVPEYGQGLALPTADNGASSEFSQYIQDLLKLRWQFERERNRAATQRRQPNVDIHAFQLEDVWRKLCELVGLSRTTMPDFSAYEVLESPREAYNGMIINVTSASLHKDWLQEPIPEEGGIEIRGRLSPPSPDDRRAYSVTDRTSISGYATSLTSYAVTSADTAITTPSLRGSVSHSQREPLEPTFSLAEPALEPYPAVMLIDGKQRHKLDWYGVTHEDDVKQCVIRWFCDNESTIIEHIG
ncbi:hypothetical protein BDY21DRAFT_2898 [Lineolata rhizophorae]|uniref:Uncharacterized protein n=1 Tax=Lineolata rhizophorae TaxID=578093 RepID=A0A6A6PDN5_9PEZI|nr:hypothetical protein BDY21DRAFT_2898 [Lineolata rhizophorae]